MNTVQHLIVVLLMATAYAVGSVSSTLIDLDHRCINCSWKEYVRLMFVGSVYNNDREVEDKLERGVLHSAGFLFIVWAAAAYVVGFAMNLTLHFVGDGL